VSQPRANLGFTGIATFGRAPVARPEDVQPGWVAVIGAPYDGGAGFWPGTRFGPRAIRDMSTRFGIFDPEKGYPGYWDLDQKRHFLVGVRAVDCGDIDIIYQDTEYVLTGITRTVRTVIERGAFPLVLGGDHSISYPVFRALDSFGPVGLVHFDAHTDYRDAVAGVRTGHASPIRRIAELPFAGRISTLGLRGIRADEKDWKAAEERGNVMVSARDWIEKGTRWALDQVPTMERFYVTIDIDCLDPAHAPGTGTPEPGGVTYGQLRELLQGLPSKGRVVGCDLVEVNPLLETTPLTALTGARLLMEVLAAVFAGDGR
jgi:agmatinase